MAQGQPPERTLADQALDIQAIQRDIQDMNTELRDALARGERHSLDKYTRWLDRRLGDLCTATAALCGALDQAAYTATAIRRRKDDPE